MKIASGCGRLYSLIIDLYTWQKSLLNCHIVNQELTEQIIIIQTPITKTDEYEYGVLVDHIIEHDQFFEMI